MDKQDAATVRSGAGKEGKYLTFSLAEEEYGIGILKVKEIVGLMPVTAVPRAPEFVKGVINLRGKVIPIIDLRLRFNMDEAEPTDRTCIIVVEVEGPSSQVQIGLMVDSVSEVLNVKAEDIEETHSFGFSFKANWLLGMAKIEGAIKILLDIDWILGAEEIAVLEEAA